MPSVIASAPGKILWLGGYSVLEKGSTSYVTAVDKNCSASVEKIAGSKIEINAPQLQAKTEFSIGAKAPGSKETLFAEKAVEACLQYFGEKGIAASGMRITTNSHAAFSSGAGKSGLGASAAITVATVAAALELHEMGENKQLTHNIAQYAHSQAQGKVGSGFDVACSVYGSIVYSRYSPQLVEGADANNLSKLFEKNWDCKIKHLPLPPKLLPSFANILGESASTSAMVRQVMAWKQEKPDDYERVINYLDDANRNAVNALKHESLDEFKRFFELGRVLTVKLGKESGAEIEPPELRSLVEESEENGAFCAKLPGAGGGDAIAALCMKRKERTRLHSFWENYGGKKLQPIELGAQSKGVRVEAL